jgi:hypothetical protein
MDTWYVRIATRLHNVPWGIPTFTVPPMGGTPLWGARGADRLSKVGVACGSATHLLGVPQIGLFGDLGKTLEISLCRCVDSLHVI